MTRSITLRRGDCLDVMATLDADSLAAMVVDPPYGLSAPPDIAVVLRAWLDGEAYEHGKSGFMGRKWDSFVPGPRYWREAFRVLKPGAHGVVFAGQRTVDLMGISLRLAGFEVRDLGGWFFASGFPKSLALGKEMDRLAGVEREGGGARSVAADKWTEPGRQALARGESSYTIPITAPATPEAQQWDGFGTALKPCIEPWLLIRKPISESSIARNVLRWGVGGLNLDRCRFAPGDPMWVGPNDDGSLNGGAYSEATTKGAAPAYRTGVTGRAFGQPTGRFPANLIYVPKASRRERERGCEHLPRVSGAVAVDRVEDSAGMGPRAGAGRSVGSPANFYEGLPDLRMGTRQQRAPGGIANHHPTVKPVALLRWLARLVTPPDGTVLDPFMGSGSCGVAAALEGFDYLGIELDEWDGNDPRARGGATYLQIARARIEHATSGRWVEAPEGSAVEDNQPQPGLF